MKITFWSFDTQQSENRKDVESFSDQVVEKISVSWHLIILRCLLHWFPKAKISLKRKIPLDIFSHQPATKTGLTGHYCSFMLLIEKYQKKTFSSGLSNFSRFNHYTEGSE